MSYQDSTGNITIDEIAAQTDKNRINQALASLENARNTVKILAETATVGQGKTCLAISEKSQELIVKIDEMISRLYETENFITNTVNYYQAIDEELRQNINSSLQTFG